MTSGEASGAASGAARDVAGGPELGGRRRMVLALLVGAGTGLLVLVSLLGRDRVPPEMPPDAEHARARAERRAGACLGCHARGTPLDRGRGHTGREDCWDCHSLADR